jgi:Zn-dependent protease with chaperone function
MFAVRGIAVSFSIFALLYGALSLAVWGVWRRVWLASQQYSARRCADLLFALRLLPFVAATGVTLALAVPSFLLLEPRAVDEPMGPAPIVLSLCGVLLMLTGMWKGAASWMQASRTVARWTHQAGFTRSSPAESSGTVSLLRISVATPSLTAAGILRPTVWLSRAAAVVLTERELKTALRHEMVHVRRRDNLRKLVLRLVSFPGMAELESAWRDATEMAADDAAVSSAFEALDLAAALIKLSRLVPLEPPAELTTALVHSPAESVNARVARLIAWTEHWRSPDQGHSLASAICAAAAVVVTLALTYGQLLVRVHTATEWLVR